MTSRFKLNQVKEFSIEFEFRIAIVPARSQIIKYKLSLIWTYIPPSLDDFGNYVVLPLDPSDPSHAILMQIAVVEATAESERPPHDRSAIVLVF